MAAMTPIIISVIHPALQ